MAAKPPARGKNAEGGRRGVPQWNQFRTFKGIDLVNARVAIADDEFFWLENAMPVGNGQIQILPTKGAALATIAAGIAFHEGFTLTIAGTPTPIIMTVNNDGSLSQINQTSGVVTAVAVAGTVTTSARFGIFRDSTILIIDPTKGYMSWTGAGVFAVIDATKLGSSVVVFQGRAWIVSPNSRTILFTAPNTFNDFTGANGAGSTIITDEAFPGTIKAVVSAVENLWIIGAGAIEAIANVVTSGGTTTFSVTNIVTGLGSNAPDSCIGYFRSLAFCAPFGVYALAGVTPQKLSDKLDGLFAALTLTSTSAAIGVVQSLPVLFFLVTYTPSLVNSLPVPASGLTTAAPLVIGFVQGKWFVATQGALTGITTLIVNGVEQVWGTDGSTVYQLFGGGTATVNYKIQSKLSDYGMATFFKALTSFGIEFQAPSPVSPMLTLDNEFTSQIGSIQLSNTIDWTNSGGTIVTWINNLNNPVSWTAQGMVLSRTVANMYGRYLGWSLSGTDAPYRIQAVQTKIALSREES